MKQHDLHSSTARKYDWCTVTASCEGRSDGEISMKLLEKEKKTTAKEKEKATFY